MATTTVPSAETTTTPPRTTVGAWGRCNGPGTPGPAERWQVEGETLRHGGQVVGTNWSAVDTETGEREITGYGTFGRAVALCQERNSALRWAAEQARRREAARLRCVRR